MQIQIKHRWSGAVLFSGDYPDMKSAVEAAISTRANLTRADLTRANLTEANLTRADLTEANLAEADLTEANLTRADLTEANLTEADLTRANLTEADLTEADLTRADLTEANLTRADLTEANLTRADLTEADLAAIKADFLSEVLKLPNELEFLRDALVAGKVDGSSYTGECACLAGTLAHACRIEGYTGAPIPQNGLTFNTDAGSPRERWFLAIRKEDTPETSQPCAIALAWTDEAIAIRNHIRKTTPQA